jgi:hypothetical protein
MSICPYLELLIPEVDGIHFVIGGQVLDLLNLIIFCSPVLAI